MTMEAPPTGGSRPRRLPPTSFLLGGDLVRVTLAGLGELVDRMVKPRYSGAGTSTGPSFGWPSRNQLPKGSRNPQSVP